MFRRIRGLHRYLSSAERGYGKIDKQRIPLTDNEIIEQNLGKYG
jgi:hypothetical protein